MAELHPAIADDDSVQKFDLDGGGKHGHAPKKSMFTDERGNLKFVNVVCKYPLPIFLLMVTICIMSNVILTELVKRDGNPFTEDGSEYDIYDPRSISYDTLRLAVEETKETYDAYVESQRRLNAEEAEPPQSNVGDITYWIYEAKTNDGMFHPDAIPSMREAEGTILEHPEYDKYCHLEYNETTGEAIACQKPLSAMNIFYASEWDSDLAESIMSQLSNPDFVNLYNLLAPCVELGLQAYCDRIDQNSDFPVTDGMKNSVLTLHLQVESMIAKWDGEGDLNENVEQVTLFLAYMKELMTKAPYVSFFFDSNFSVENPVSMYSRSIVYWGELLNGAKDEEDSEDKLKRFILDNLVEEWNEITEKDYDDEAQSYFFMGALIFDLILQILALDGAKAFASFVFVFFYLRIMLGSWFLTAVGMFEIFMSLPLAWVSFSYIFQIKYFSTLNVLCLFIVMAIGADDIFVFMDAYKQSANRSPDILDDLETRMTWVYRRSGSAMLLTSITTCSAFLCTLISPLAGTRSFGVFAAFVILFDYVLVMTLFCTAVVIYHNRFEAKDCCCDCTFWKRSDPDPTQIAKSKRENNEPKETDRISVFFEEKVGPFMLNQRNRLIIFAVLLAWIVVSCIYTAKLEPTTASEQFLNENHPLQIGATILSNEFPKTQEDLTSQIHFVWGLEDINRDGVNQLLDPEFVGNAKFSDGFEFSETCQAAILNACDYLVEDDNGLEDFILRKNGLRNVDCFVEQLGSSYVSTGTGTSTNCVEVERGAWRNETWTVPPEDLSSTMESFVNEAACEGDFESVKTYYKDTIGWDGSDMKFAGISLYSSLLDPRAILAEDVVRVHYEKFLDVAKMFDDMIGDSCGTGIQTTMTDLDQKFVFMNNQRIYRTSAVSGSMVGVAVAFVVVFISTFKLHLALFATVCILAVLLGVIGSVSMLGWTLGTIEAILISILAGFSVDYVIHLAHAYHHSEGDVEERVVAAYGDMGISVFSGMLTSVVASIPLFFCTLTFFEKFGTFLCLTIVLSWIFANFGFMALLAQFKVNMDRKWL